MNAPISTQMPQAWTATQVREDLSWIIHLDDEHKEQIHTAMLHAQSLNKPFLEMTRDDFPINDATRQVLDKAIRLTQHRWGLALVKGVPVDDWTEDQARLAYWGMGLHMGVARTQNRASEIMKLAGEHGIRFV